MDSSCQHYTCIHRWSVYCLCLQCSIPAPLFYNEDSTPDLLVRINHGVWHDHYNYSTVAILDGRNGDELWHIHSVKTGMMSSLSLASDHLGADGAVFIAVGTVDEDNPVINEVINST